MYSKSKTRIKNQLKETVYRIKNVDFYRDQSNSNKNRLNYPYYEQKDN